MSQAPRHSNARTLNSRGRSPAASRDAVEQLVGAAQRAGDVRAHVDAVAADRVGLEHVVEGRDRVQVGGRDAHHAGDLLDRLRRAPAVHALGGVQRRQRRRAAVGVVAMCASISARSSSGTASSPGRGSAPGPSRGRPARSQPGRARRRRSARTGVIGRSLRGSDRASPAWRSCRRCRRPRPCARAPAG